MAAARASVATACQEDHPDTHIGCDLLWLLLKGTLLVLCIFAIRELYVKTDADVTPPHMYVQQLMWDAMWCSRRTPHCPSKRNTRERAEVTGNETLDKI